DQNGPSARREERSISESIRDRRATRPPAHFDRNPPGRGQLAAFPRSLLTYRLDMLVARALKSGQLTCGGYLEIERHISTFGTGFAAAVLFFSGFVGCLVAR